MNEPNEIACRCGGATKVTDSRTRAGEKRRRRECLVCGERFGTIERRDDREESAEMADEFRAMPSGRRRVLLALMRAMAEEAARADDERAPPEDRQPQSPAADQPSPV